jgi:antitoxin (DNA-binding transcriptional repressor) of toxin-antitoxin stability system
MYAKSPFPNPRSHHDTNHSLRSSRNYPNLTQAQKTGEPLTIRQNGIALAIISPIQKKSLLEILSTLEPLNENLMNNDRSR